MSIAFLNKFFHKGFIWDIILVYAVNITALAFSMGINILVPKYASREVYATYRTLILYANYAGFFHFGLLNGFYLFVIGKKIDGLNKEIVQLFQKVLIKLQIIILPLVFLLLNFILSGSEYKAIVPLVIISYFLGNLITFFNYLYQGTKNFKKFAAITIFGNLCGITVIAFIIATGTVNSNSLAFAFIAPLFIVSILYQISYRKDLDILRNLSDDSKAARSKPILQPIIFDNGVVKSFWQRGIWVFLANVGISLIFSMGSLVANNMLIPADFASFAFAYGLCSIFYTIMDSLSVAMIPSLARNMASENGENRINSFVFLFLIWIIPTSYWFSSYLVHYFYPAYKEIDPIVVIFSTAIPFIAFIRSKIVSNTIAQGAEKRFLVIACVGLCMMFFSIAIAVLYHKTITGIAMFWSGCIIALAIFGGLYLDKHLKYQSFQSRNLYSLLNCIAAALSFLLVINLDGVISQIGIYILIAIIVLFFNWKKCTN